MAVQIQKESLGRNLIIIKDLTGVATTDASETNLLVNGDGFTLVSNGYINMGELAGCTLKVEYYNATADVGTLRSYGAMTQATTYQYSAASDQAISASVSATYTISNCPQFLRLTVQRTTTNITIRYRITGYKLGGTM